MAVVNEKEIVRLYVEEKKSVVEVAKILGTSRGLTWHYLMKNRVQMRPKATARDEGKDFSYVSHKGEGCGCSRCIAARAKGIRA